MYMCIHECYYMYYCLCLGEGIPTDRRFNFTRMSERSCQSLSLSVDALEALQDTVFSVEIVRHEESGFQLGSTTTATITVEAAERKQKAHTVRVKKMSTPLLYPTLHLDEHI